MNGAAVGGVFISYSSADRAIVSAAARLLRAGGATVFQDVIDIEFGTRWNEVLFAALARCERVMVFWSAAAAKSEWVEREWRSALEAKKRIVPMVLDDTPLPAPLSEFHGVPDLVDMLRAAMQMTAHGDATRTLPQSVEAGPQTKGRLYAAISALGALVVVMGAWMALQLHDAAQVDQSRGEPDVAAAAPPVFLWGVWIGLVVLLILGVVLWARWVRLRMTPRDDSGGEPLEGLPAELRGIGNRFTAALFDEPIDLKQPPG